MENKKYIYENEYKTAKNAASQPLLKPQLSLETTIVSSP